MAWGGVWSPVSSSVPPPPPPPPAPALAWLVFSSQSASYLTSPAPGHTKGGGGEGGWYVKQVDGVEHRILPGDEEGANDCCQYVNNVNSERVIRREDRKTDQPSLSCDNFGLLCPADVELNIIDFFFSSRHWYYAQYISSLGNFKDIKYNSIIFPAPGEERGASNNIPPILLAF